MAVFLLFALGSNRLTQAWKSVGEGADADTHSIICSIILPQNPLEVNSDCWQPAILNLFKLRTAALGGLIQPDIWIRYAIILELVPPSLWRQTTLHQEWDKC
jgi:hypothetical protein